MHNNGLQGTSGHGGFPKFSFSNYFFCFSKSVAVIPLAPEPGRYFLVVFFVF
jgi:hypothetical protein